MPGILERALYKLTAYLPCRIIRGFANEPYLERYKFASLGPVRVFIHRFVASDPDRGIHDHPWDWSFSLVLTGGYNEVRMMRRGDPTSVIQRRIRPFTVNIIRGHDFHRIVLPEGRTAWSMFFHGPRTKRWGFLEQMPDGSFGSLEENYQLQPERKSDEAPWWKTAPKGREADRHPA